MLAAALLLALAMSGGQACKYRDHNVIPDVIDNAPTKALNISFPSGAGASYGNELTPTQVKDMPKVYTDLDDKDGYYTLAFVDPDVPSRKNPEQGQWLHWLVVNIPGSSFQDGDVSAGHTMAEYISSAPPEGSGLHRYVFLLYKQVGPIEPKENVVTATTARGRPKFDIRTYAREYNLGDPLSGNFYQAQYDDYVPVVHATLKD
ncbi:protein D2-like [Bacillus rossius redtenbacheri]|uniref:protein D2-like n=1 Tax=Bacillus rossius redtenbacheri TaxID=93214 RepID=UPI002FDCCEB5